MMRGVSVGVMMVVMVSGVAASGDQSGLSWCSESTFHNLRILKEKKPELGRIPVLVNHTLMEDIIDEVIVRQQSPCEGITFEEAVPLDGEAAMLVQEEDGEISLWWRSPTTIPLFQRIDDFCISVLKDGPEGSSFWITFLAKFCSPDPVLQKEEESNMCSETTCVRKCCPARMSLSHGSMCAAVEEGQDWQHNLTSSEPVHMLYGPPPLCENALMYHQFSILPSGKLEMEGLYARPDAYCIDSTGESLQGVALVCSEEVTSFHCELKRTILRPILLGISAVCFIIVWIVYVSVAPLRKQNEGRCILCLVSALFVAYVTLIILNTTPYRDTSMFCVVLGVLCHFSLLASYFWMNVFSFHTFVRLRSEKDGKWERASVFALYSLYAWGCPLVVVVVGVVVDNMEVGTIRPGIINHCWISDSTAFWTFLYGPMLVLLLINVAFFLGCVVQLSCGHRRVTFTPSSGEHYTQSAWLFVRLFILTGILWVAEVLSFSLFSYCGVAEWIFDIINSLQGILVLIATICCRRNLKVFHCGRPQLIQKSRHSEITTAQDASEMATNPLVS